MQTALASQTEAALDLLTRWSRALSVYTADEIRAIPEWGTPIVREAIDKLDGAGFEGRLATHNPIYYLAERVYFANVIDDPNFLYPPLHRDRFCKGVLDYYLEPYDADTCGFLCLMPRLTYKSTFMHGVLPLFLALREKVVYKRDCRILMVHHKEEQASRNLGLLKQKCIYNKWLKETWPEIAQAKDWGTQTEFDWTWKEPGIFHEPSVKAIGLDSRSTGDHYDFIIYDDIVTKEHTFSRVVRDKCAENYAASRFLLDTVRSKEFDCGTRYHPQDQWQRLLDSNVDGRHLYRRLVIQGLDDATDELCHPFRLSRKKLEQIRQEFISRDGTDVQWHLQIQNCVQTSGLIATDESWLRYCFRLDVPKGWTIITVDPAWKGTKNAGQGDNAAIAVIRLVKIGLVVFRYLIDLSVSNEMTSYDGQREIFRLMKKYNVKDIGVEELGGHTFRTMLDKEAGPAGIQLNLLELESKQTAKPERISAFLKHVHAGHFFIAKECPNQEAFMTEYKSWPLVDHDDVMDAIAYSCDPAILEMYAPRTLDALEAMKQPWVPPQYISRYCLR